MEVIKESGQARAIISELKANKLSIGVVPTMGALHHGHLSLIEACNSQNDKTVVTIFVNPIQFNNPDDYSKYPVSIEDDLSILESLGVNYVFMPSKEEMYEREPLLKMSFGHLEEVLEGKFRPGHFNGVAIVVTKLFNILSPTRAYFGQKDLQQFKVIERVVNDLSSPVELVMMPIIRESNGLAMSSRNQRLSEAALNVGSEIYKSLQIAAHALQSGESIDAAVNMASTALLNFPEIETEYLEVVNLEDLSAAQINTAANRLVLCFAGYLEGVRLIDNIVVGENF